MTQEDQCSRRLDARSRITPTRPCGKAQRSLLTYPCHEAVAGGRSALVRPGTECGIILLASHNERDLVLKGIRSGAVSYVLKESAGDELVRAMSSAYHHQSYFSPPVAMTMREERISTSVVLAQPQTDLSEQEVAILQGLATGQRDKDIAKQRSLSKSTISKYVLRIMEKLHAENRSHAVALAKDQKII